MKSTQHNALSKGWGSVHQWYALLDNGYSPVFEYNCNHFEHYLDATMRKIDTIQTLESETQDAGCYTSIESDIFVP